MHHVHKFIMSNLTPEAAHLLKRLRQVQSAKKYMLSGIYDKEELDFIKNATGSYPVVRGIDMMKYSPINVRYEGQNSDEAKSYIEDSKKFGFINTASWHWSPSVPGVDNTNYYNAFYRMDLDVLNHMDALQADVDAIAEPLKKFKDANIPILWRPLHEVTQYAWFWWSKDSHTFKTIYNMMYDRLTKHHGLNNLLWVWNPAHNYNYSDSSFYPGDDKVHVVASDYPPDIVAAYSGLKKIAHDKPVAIAEISWSDWGKYLDNFNSSPFCYVCSWCRELGAIKAGVPAVRKVYDDKRVKALPWK